MEKHKAVQLKKDLYFVGVFDPNLRIFDIEMFTPFGSSYNAYLIKGKKANVLIETVKEGFYEEMLERLDDVLGKDEKIDYVIHNHTEPDHSGSSYRLIKERYPNATIIASQNAVAYLKEIGNEDVANNKYLSAGRDIKNLDIGGYTFEFYQAPFLHWPDSMFTYVPELKSVFTCDVFGSHFHFPDLIDTKIDVNSNQWKDYIESYKYYYDCIFAPFPKYVLDGCKIIRKLQKTKGIEFIGTAHGPMLTTEHIDELVGYYEKWAEIGKTDPKKRFKEGVTIAYVSAYGYTGEMAKEIAKGIESQNIPVKLFDALYDKEEDILKSIKEYRGILLGTPTIVNDALPHIWKIAVKLNSMVNMGQYGGTFGSFGWSGEATNNIDQRLQQVKLKLPLDPLKIKFRPSKSELEKCFEWGSKFARAIKGEKISERKKASTEAAKKGSGKPVYPKDGKLRRWKCIVCGEIIISKIPPDQCPACSAEGDIWVDLGIVETKEGKSDETEYNGTVAIIGGSSSGFTAVKAIREKNSKCKVLLFSDEGIPYYRPSVTKKFEMMTDKNWLDQHNIELINDKVVSISSKEKKLKVQNGETYSFDRAILAVGSTPFNPFPNAENVFTIRTINDMNNLIKYTISGKKYKKPVIIGGGLLGLESAEKILEFNKKEVEKMTMIECMPRILPRQLDEAGSDLYVKILKDQGLDLKIGSLINTFETKEIIDEKTKEKKTIATKVIFKDGSELETDCIVVAIGVRPDLELANELGLKINRAIVVDEEMKTSIPDIYACGDCAEFHGVFVPNFTNAVAQGNVAGWSSCGVLEKYKDKKENFIFKREHSPYTLTSFNTNVYSLGEVNECHSFLSKRENDNSYFKLAFDAQNKMCGALAIVKGALPGNLSTVALTRGVTEKISMIEAMKKFFS